VQFDDLRLQPHGCYPQPSNTTREPEARGPALPRLGEQDVIPDLSQGFMRMAEHDCREPSMRGMDIELRAIV
jgi:hypothetical protein